MAFYHVPTEFLLAFLCVLMMISLRFHGTHNACTISWQHVEDAVRSQRTLYSLHANTSNDHGICTTILCALAELLLCCRRLYCEAMANLQQPYSALISGICFEHAQSPHRRSAFYCDLTASTGHATVEMLAFCIFLGRHGIAVRKLLWHDRGLKDTTQSASIEALDRGP